MRLSKFKSVACVATTFANLAIITGGYKVEHKVSAEKICSLGLMTFRSSVAASSTPFILICYFMMLLYMAGRSDFNQDSR